MSAEEHLDEKAFNQDLASVLARHNRVADIDAEKTGKLLDKQGQRGAQPDVIVVHPGRESVLVENKYDNRPERELIKQCEERLERKWANGLPVRAVVGLRTPHRMASVTDVAGAIEEASDFQWAAWTSDAGRLPESGWIRGTIAEFVGFVARVGAEATDADALTNQVKQALTSAGNLIGADTPTAHGFGKVLLQESCAQTNRMAMAVMFNAIVFQSHIARHHDEVSSPTQMLAAGNATQRTVLEEWQAILEINYWPIFGVSRELLLSISDESVAGNILHTLFASASDIASVTGSQGVIGRIFGELIGDRKFLATFYTLPSAAAMLADMAVERLDIDWSDPKAIAALRVGDMACGTGALLTAVYARISERHLLAGGSPEELHQSLMEDVMIGCDIMPAAVHLTAARLSGEHPNIDYTSTQTWVMPYGFVSDKGGRNVIKLGSLDLQHTQDALALWGDGSIAASATGEVHHTTAHIDAESLDLAIMNPPFTRATNHEGGHGNIPNPAFAGMGNNETAQEEMSKALKRLRAKIEGRKASHGNVGIASNFVDLAHAKLKPGGVLALVLPVAATSGADWENFRKLLGGDYADITVTTISATPGSDEEGQSRPGKTDRAFSADTGMGEVLVVATKLSSEPATQSGQPEHGDPPQVDSVASNPAKPVNFISLSDRPRSVAEGVEAARATRQPQHDHWIRMGNSEIGWAVSGGFEPGQGHPSGIFNPDVAKAAADITEGRLRLPPSYDRPLPITQLAELGHAGPVHRDINGVEKGKPRGPFTITKFANREKEYKNTSRPVLWRHEARKETRLYVLPCSKATVRHNMDADATKIWKGGFRTQKPVKKISASEEDDNRIVAGATRLHINCDFDVTSQPLGACLTPAPALGGRAWPSFAVHPPQIADADSWEKALCVWMNTSIGLLGRWWVSTRQQWGRANLTITMLGTIPVIDLRNLSQQQLQKLAAVFDAFSGRDLLPANQADQDAVRHELDEQVLCWALGLPTSILNPLSTLRHQWCNEPSNL